MKEKTLHQLFADSRVNPARQFFKLSPEKVVLAIQMGSFEEVTPGKANLPADEEAAKEKAEEAGWARGRREAPAHLLLCARAQINI